MEVAAQQERQRSASSQTSDERTQIMQAHAGKRVVVKLGTNVVSEPEGGDILRSLTEEMIAMKRASIELILVSSGAVAEGKRRDPQLLSRMLARYPDAKEVDMQLAANQEWACMGQPYLMTRYAELFAESGINVSQKLLTKYDLTNPKALDNIRRSRRFSLVDPNIIPIVNENDLVATEEFRTDNDELACLVAQEVKADMALLLSNVDGVRRDPNDSSTHIDRMERSRVRLDDFNFNGVSNGGRGGMASKVKSALALGPKKTEVVIANGLEYGIITEILAGRAKCTRIVP